MKKFLRALPTWLALPIALTLSVHALAQCSGSSGVPFNCQPGQTPVAADQVLGGATTGTYANKTVAWNWSQVFNAGLDATLGNVTATSLSGAAISGGSISGTPISGSTGAFSTLSATGPVTLSPANQPVVISPTGSGTLVINPGTLSSIDNVAIGQSTPSPGTFTTFAATGSVLINPATLSSIDNVAIGQGTPMAGTFTTLAATGAATLSPANQPVTLAPTGTGSVLINPATAGTLDNVAIGQTTPKAVAASTLTVNGKSVAPVGNLTTTGGTNSLNFNLTGATNITLPTSGTMITVVPNYLTGVTLSNDSGTPNSKLDIAAGVAADSTNAQMITIGAFVKSTAGAWTSGTGNNGMGNGLTIADSTWYHVCLAYNGGTPDVWFDTSAVCANVPSGLSGTLFRRIGSFETNSSAQIFAFNQTGDRFDRALPVLEYQGTPGVTTAASLSLSGVPTGVVVTAILSGYIADTTGENSGLYISSLAQTDTAATGALAVTGIIGSAPSAEALGGFSGFTVVTNTSAAVRRRTNSTTAQLVIITNGWIDTRGK